MVVEVEVVVLVVVVFVVIEVVVVVVVEFVVKVIEVVVVVVDVVVGEKHVVIFQDFQSGSRLKFGSFPCLYFAKFSSLNRRFIISTKLGLLYLNHEYF